MSASNFSTVNSSGQSAQASTPNTSIVVDPRIEEVKAACAALQLKVEEPLQKLILSRISATVKARVEHVCHAEEVRAWKEELEPHRFVRLVTKVLLGKKPRKPRSPKGPTGVPSSNEVIAQSKLSLPKRSASEGQTKQLPSKSLSNEATSSEKISLNPWDFLVEEIPNSTKSTENIETVSEVRSSPAPAVSSPSSSVIRKEEIPDGSKWTVENLSRGIDPKPTGDAAKGSSISAADLVDAPANPDEARPGVSGENTK
jgi:hypothetical protein